MSVCLCLCVAHSRTVVHVNIQAVPLSCDHKPSRPDEMKRIEKSGGFVMHLGVPRVNGVLAVSRALGDAELKHLVPSQPEYRTLSRRCVVPEVSQPEGGTRTLARVTCIRRRACVELGGQGACSAAGVCLGVC